MLEKNKLTREGLKELKAELKRLVNIERPKVIEDIKEARAQGDLSENAEFDAAREKQGQIEDRIKEIEDIIENFEIISSSSNSTVVSVGSVVEVLDLESNEKSKYSIVGTLEADPFESKISYESPLAQAILGKSIGDEATIETTPKYNIKIINIEK